MSLEELAAGDSSRPGFQPANRETPEATFHRVWLTDLGGRVVRRLGQECHATGLEVHFELLRPRIVQPALEGSEPPPLRDPAGQFGLTKRQAANCVLTARCAYRRLLEAEIRVYAGSDAEGSKEIRDLFRFLGEP